MWKVVYKYEFVERKRVYKGFEVNKIIKEELVDVYNTLEEAKRHPNIEIEKEYFNGYYCITKIES